MIRWLGSAPSVRVGLVTRRWKKLGRIAERERMTGNVGIPRGEFYAGDEGEVDKILKWI